MELWHPHWGGSKGVDQRGWIKGVDQRGGSKGWIKEIDQRDTFTE